MTVNPFVSIIIPAYKSDFFHDCLSSAIEQTYANFEVVICDDSLNNSIENIVNSFCNHKNFHKIVYIKNEKNIGSRENYKKVFRISKGEYIKFLNDDDMLEKTCIEKQIYYFQQYPNVVLVTSKRQRIEGSGKHLPDDISTQTPSVFAENEEGYSYVDGFYMGDLVLTSLVNFIGEPTTVMFPKKLIEKNEPTIFSLNGKDIWGNGDLAMWFNLLCQGDAIYINEPLSYFRIHSAQDQNNTSVIYRCTVHWYHLLVETPKMGFLKNKKNLYLATMQIGNLMDYYSKEKPDFSDEQKNNLANLAHDTIKLKEELEKEFFHCPVCNSYIDEFIPLSNFYEEEQKKHGWIYKSDDFETINTKQYTCPKCYCSDRERLYALYINKKIEELDKNKSYNFSEFAPSNSLGSFIKSKNRFKYRTADLFMDNVDDKVDITEMDIYKNNSFDCFICSHVLEHVSDDRKALKELYRITKPDGWGICVVPINLKIDSTYEDATKTTAIERWQHFGQDDHVRVYSKNGFKERLQEAGFSVEEYGKDFFGEEVFIKNGISLKSVLYIVEKKLNFDELKKEAELIFDSGNYQKAEELFIKLTNYDESNPEIFFKLALCQMKQENYEEATENFSQAIDLGMITSEVFYNIAVSLSKTGEDEIAEEYIKNQKNCCKKTLIS